MMMTSLAFPFAPLISICPCWPRAPKAQPRDDPVQVRVQTELSSSCRILSRNWFMVALANCFFRPLLLQYKWVVILLGQVQRPSWARNANGRANPLVLHVHTRLNCVTT